MTPPEAVLLTIAAFSVVMAVLTITARSAVRASLFFCATSIGTAGLFVQLGTPLLAAAGILTGVIGSAFLCLVIAVSNSVEVGATNSVRARTVTASAASLGVFFLLCWILPFGRIRAAVVPGGSLGELLSGDYLLPLMVTAFAIIVVVIGSVVLAHEALVTNNDSQESSS